MQKKIIFKIDPLGNPTIDAEGFKGTSCKNATEAFEKVFEGGQANVIEKPEMMEEEDTSEMEQMRW